MITNILIQWLITIILAILTVAAPFIVTIFFKWLKAKMGNERFTHLMQRIDVGVKAIEARMGAGNGADKKKEVELLIANKLKWADKTDVSNIIDATVQQINIEIKKGSDNSEQTTKTGEN
jgi:hypothetical protein